MKGFYHVLIVDDDPDQAEMVEEYLRVTGSFEVDIAGSIQELWKRLDTGSYDLILMDYILPDGTGLDALDGVSERGYPAPVVMVTGQGDERIAVQAIQRGAQDYLLKSGDYLLTLPALIRKTVRAYRLHQSVQESLDQIRYQATLLNNVRDAIVVWDMEGRITYWNPAAVALFGWQVHERVGQLVAEVYLSAFTPPLTIPREGDTSGQHIVRECQTKTGQTIWVSSRVAALRDVEANNRIIGYMDVSHDITKRKEAEQALRAERNFVSAVLDTVGALVVVLDPQARIVRFNRACEQVSGYSFAEVRGKYLWDLFILPEEQETARFIFQDIQSGEFPNTSENSWLTRHGEHRLIRWSNTAITNRASEVEYIIATGIDITERWRAEKALRESEARYRAIVDDYQTELICRFLPDGKLTFVNEVYCSYYGKSRADLIGQNFLDMLPQDDQARVREHLASFNPENPVASIEHKVLLPGQGMRWQQWTDRAIFSEEGRLFEFQSVGRDVTERKLMEAQIQAAQTHLAQAARLATIGELASGVAHQINNPLTTIIADAQILMRRLAENHPGRDSAEAIEQAGWRLQEVVQRLLEFSRPSAFTLEWVYVNESIRRALSLVGAHIESAGVRLEVDLAENLPAVRGNQRQLEDLWVNLLLLARDAASQGGGQRVWIQTKSGSEKTVVVRVADDGIPIPPERLDSIFEPNFIGDATGRGTGLELSICREIVRQHHGWISAESTDDHVTIFSIVLPTERTPTGMLSSERVEAFIR